MDTIQRDGTCVSTWQKSMPAYTTKSNSNFKHISAEVFDVAIIGGGITGVSCALKLQKAGKRCILLESKNLGFGTTSGTTAHLNTILDTPYYKIASNFGDDTAKLVARAAGNAIELIKRNAEEFIIDCDFEDAVGYIFSQNEEQDKELEKILQSAKDVDQQVEYATSIPVSIPFTKAVVFQNQAKFHPIKYLYGIAQAFESLDGFIFQNCKVMEVENSGDYANVKTTLGNVIAQQVIYATHIPPGVNVIHFKCAPYRSYAIAVKLADNKYPEGLVYDMHDPYHYYRTHKIDGEDYLIAGGEDHKTGHMADTEQCFTNLEKYISNYFKIESVAFKWSSQYFEPADGLPYIGRMPGNPDNIFTATGFGGNGLIYGTVSALVLSDIIANGSSEYQHIFSPNRIKPTAEFKNVVKEGADVVSKLLGGWLPATELESLANIGYGEGKIVNYQDKKIALHRDMEGHLYALNPACPHIQCEVKWNSAEKSWDCPCHGSRFSINGEMLTAPARNNLAAIELRKEAR